MLPVIILHLILDSLLLHLLLLRLLRLVWRWRWRWWLLSRLSLKCVILHGRRRSKLLLRWRTKVLSLDL